MSQTKNSTRERAKQKNLLDETTWKNEKQKLKRLSRLLWFDVQKLESLFCLDVKKTINFFDEVRRFEINLIKTALFQTGGSQRRSAALLGISTSNLNNKIKHYRIVVSNSKENVF